MFQAKQIHTGATVWESSHLAARGVTHLFTTKAWNVQSAEDVTDVVRAAGWFAAEQTPRIVMSKQVHTNAVDTPGHRLAEADAHVTDDPREVVAVRTADCVSVLLSSADGRVVAAVHAGWRGLDPAVNVIGRAAAALRKQAGGAAADGFVAAIGPCVSAARYEVGEEVAARFRERYPSAVLDNLGPKPHLDTRAVALAQLVESGLTAGQIDVFPGCTFDDSESFFSYRREGVGVGHLAALIAPRPEL